MKVILLTLNDTLKLMVQNKQKEQKFSTILVSTYFVLLNNINLTW